MDKTALFKLSYGLYVVGSAHEGTMNAQIANTVFQINDDPATIAISLNNKNYTKELVDKSGVFSVNVLSTAADMDIVANFGFKSGRDFNKFAAYQATPGKTGSPILSTNQIAANLEAEVIHKLEVGTHTIYIGKLVDAIKLPATQMTYAEYHQMKNQKTPAPAEAQPGAKCNVCGYIENNLEALKDPNYTCPICSVGPDQFTMPQAPAAPASKGAKCNVCGYIEYDLEALKDPSYTCPICGVGPDQFTML